VGGCGERESVCEGTADAGFGPGCDCVAADVDDDDSVDVECGDEVGELVGEPDRSVCWVEEK